MYYVWIFSPVFLEILIMLALNYKVIGGDWFFGFAGIILLPIYLLCVSFTYIVDEKISYLKSFILIILSVILKNVVDSIFMIIDFGETWGGPYSLIVPVFIIQIAVPLLIIFISYSVALIRDKS